MKKLALILCLAMLLGLFGCNGNTPGDTAASQPETTGQTGETKLDAFSVGYAREDVTPKEEDVILDGWGDSNRRSKGVKDPICVTCVSLSDTQGMFIKDNSPFKMTFIMGYANDMNFYMPSELSFENGCYEVDNSYYIKGTAEALADRYVAMLNALHG